MRKWAVPHSNVVSDDGTDDDVTNDGIVHNGYQHTESIPTSSRGVWQITWDQAALVLSDKPDGSFLIREESRKVHDPSLSSSINTHDISVV